VNDKKGAKEAMQILEKLSLSRDQPSKYDPHFIIGIGKGKKNKVLNTMREDPWIK
jgi:hypothetical protein